MRTRELGLVLILSLFAGFANCAQEISCDGDRICLKDVVEGKYSPEGFNGTWISDTEIFYIDEEYNFRIFDVDNLTSHLLISSENLAATFPAETHHLFYGSSFKLLRTPQEDESEDGGFSAEKYELSPDRKFLLFANDFDPKHGTILKAHYFVYSVETHALQALHPGDVSSDTKLQYASWGSIGSQLLFVHEFSVYYQETATSSPVRILESEPGSYIYHTIPDWIYPDDAAPSFVWSEDGSKICIFSYNNSQVRDFQYGFYGDINDTKNVYTELVDLKYPKPGTPIAITNLTVVDLKNNFTLEPILAPERYLQIDHYVSFSEWISNDTLLVGYMNRLMNRTSIYVCERTISIESNWECREIFDYSLTNGWLELYPSLVYEDGLFMKYPIFGSKRHLYEHIAHISKDGDLMTLTKGDWQVTSILGYDKETGFVYYIASEEGKPRARHFYRVPFSANMSGATAEPECLSCGGCCRNIDVSFSPGMKYYVTQCQGPEVPRVEIKSTIDNSVVVNYENNQNLTERYKGLVKPKVKQYKVHLSKDYYAYVRLYIPPDLPEDGSKKAPLLIYVYGGPTEQIVNDDFEIGFSTYMSTARNVVYAKIDVRGGSMDGLNKTFEMYRQMGTVEIKDFIHVAKFLRNSFPYIDRDRIGMWGWSYGGYATLRTLILDDEVNPVFCCGVAVAPVTSWLYYHAGYVERMIGYPTEEDNLAYYIESDVISHADKLKNKTIFLVHGTNDDNVHFQNTAMLMKALSQADVYYRSQVYPDEDHNMGGVYSHLFHSIDNFLVDAFNLF